jgi:hypothetical protein
MLSNVSEERITSIFQQNLPAIYQQNSGQPPATRWFLDGLIFDPEDAGDTSL